MFEVIQYGDIQLKRIPEKSVGSCKDCHYVNTDGVICKNTCNLLENKFNDQAIFKQHIKLEIKE